MSIEFKTKWPSLPYILPFAVFMLLLAAEKYVPFGPAIEYPLRDVILLAVLWAVSRQVIELHSYRRLETVLIGIAVFVVWIAPDALIPGYRHHWLFQNAIVGSIGTPPPADVLLQPVVLWSRIFRAVVLVPVIEELFWRAWLMRWLISPQFEKIPLGTYKPLAFWLTAVLFAAEHGSYWEVGLIAGVVYNWWMVRTRSLGDCILMHAVTNACLCGYVVATRHFEYWM